MEMMDLSTNQTSLRIEKKFELKEPYHETDIKGNNNFLTCFKTEVNNIIAHDGSSLFQGGGTKEKKLEVDNALFSYSSFKKAMDLRTHNRTVEEKRRTIFEDAEYFSENHRYKLLPITFEQVDETIIRLEHNYVLSSLNSESEQEEDCSRTMDYSRVLERNYKKRKTKTEQPKTLEDEGGRVVESSSMMDESPTLNGETETVVEPLDLSAAPLVQEEKTESHTREVHHGTSVEEKKDGVEVPEKESSKLKGILVTITRPDEKENYEPCDLFLNDIARLVPWLIDKNCFEIDIMDRTCDRRDELRNHRLYYVISEATWRLFQKSNERVILTNDPNLGEPLKRTEKEEKPSYLVFDQYSLAKCLAEFCQEIGGCFEYACVEEGKEETVHKEEKKNVVKEETKKSEENVTEDEKKGNIKYQKEDTINEKKKDIKDQKKEDIKDQKKEDIKDQKKEDIKDQKKEDIKDQMKEDTKEQKKEDIEDQKKEDIKVQEKEDIKDQKKEDTKNQKKEDTKNEENENVKDEKKEEIVQKKEKSQERKPKEEEKVKEVKKEIKSKKAEGMKETDPSLSERKRSLPDGEKAPKPTAVPRNRESSTEEPLRKKEKKPKTPSKPRLKTPRTTAEHRSTSELDASQKSDKPVSKKRKKESEMTKEEPPATRRKTTNAEELPRSTRSRKNSGETKKEKTEPKTLRNKGTGKKKEKEVKKKNVPEKEKNKGKGTKEAIGVGRRLRSQKIVLMETRKKKKRTF